MSVASRSLVVLALSASLSACAPTYRLHGFAPPENETDQVLIGADDRAAVLVKLGQPSTRSALGEGSGWYYIQSKMEHYAFYAPKEVERIVVAVTFDETGAVDAIRRFGLENGRVIDLATGVTPTYGRELTIIQQIFGNFGQINPAQLLGDR